MVVDPRRTETSDEADLHLAIRPGSDVALMNGLLAHARATGQVDEAYLARSLADDGQSNAAEVNAIAGGELCNQMSGLLCGRKQFARRRFFTPVKKFALTIRGVANNV